MPDIEVIELSKEAVEHLLNIWCCAERFLEDIPVPKDIRERIHAWPRESLRHSVKQMQRYFDTLPSSVEEEDATEQVRCAGG